MEVICYACGKGEFPENTLEGIVHCQKTNPNWRIEMDLQLTKDGKVVLFHDDNLTRIIGIDKQISQTSYTQLLCHNIAVNLKKENNFLLSDKLVKIPLLHTVFRNFPKAKFLLDIHATNTEIVEKVITLVERHSVEKQIVFVSRHHHILEYFRSKRPFWRYGASSKEVTQLLFAHYFRFGKLLKLKAEIIMMPVIYQNRKILSKKLTRLIFKKHKNIWIWLHQGKQVITIDSKNQYERIKKYNADAFFTSCPEQLYNEMFSLLE